MTSRHPWSTSAPSTASLAYVAALALAATLAIAVAFPSLAGAQSGPAEYEKLVKEGSELFAEEEWVAAREKFEKAYSIHPEPLVLFNIASTYRREGIKEEALKYYKKYLEVAPPDAEYRRVAEEAVVTIEEQIEVDNRAVPQPRPAPVADDRSGKVLRYSGLALGVVGIASLSFGIYQGLEARELNDRFENLEPETEWTQELDAEFKRGESLEQQAIIFSVVGGVAIAAGGALYVAGMLSEQAGERRVSIAPVANGDSASVVFSGRF